MAKITLILIIISSIVQAHSGDGSCDSAFIDSFEDLLRSQSDLFTSFDELLNNTDPSIEQKVEFMISFEDLLRRQATLISSFEDILKMKWDCLSEESKNKYLESFEDLLEREVVLYNRFENLIKDSHCHLTQPEKVKLLRSYEDLLRRQADLFKSFEELFKMKIGGIFIEKSVDATKVMRGDTVTYSYTVTNWFNKSLFNVSIIDSNLGVVATGAVFLPKETKIFNKTTTIKGDTCNTARVIADDGHGHTFTARSNVVCVTVEKMNFNYDWVQVGNQEAMTMAGDPPSAMNNLKLKKNQKAPEGDSHPLVNYEKVIIGNQRAFGARGESVNKMELALNQG